MRSRPAARSATSPARFAVVAAHSTRLPTLEAEGRDGRATIARAELVAASLLALPAGEARTWEYSWTPPTAGDVALVVDYPELYREYGHLRHHRFAVSVAA